MRTIIYTLIRTASERRRRGPDEGFRVAVLHPVDFYEVEREIGQAIARHESWALATHRPTTIQAFLLPQGLEVRCSPGIARGWAIFEDHRGIESMTMVALAAADSPSGDTP